MYSSGIKRSVGARSTAELTVNSNECETGVGEVCNECV